RNCSRARPSKCRRCDTASRRHHGVNCREFMRCRRSFPALTALRPGARLRDDNTAPSTIRRTPGEEDAMPKRRNDQPAVGRRNFLKGAGLVGAAALAPAAAKAQAVTPRANLKAAVPGPAQFAADYHPPTKETVTQSSSGGDFMVDVLKTLDIDYLAMNSPPRFRRPHDP